MARFEISGTDIIASGLQDMLDDLPQLRDDILKAEADVIEQYMIQSITSNGLVRSGVLRQSIRQRKRKDSIAVGPDGEHHRYTPSGKRSGANGIVTAGYVGYVHNYGIPRRGIPAREWAEKAVEKGQGPAMDAAEKVYDEFLKKHDL